MKKTSRVAFTLAMGVMVGSLSVFMNLGSPSVAPAEASSQVSGLQAMYDQLSDEQKEKIKDALKNQNISQEDLSKFADLEDINPTDIFSGF